jgi:molecular chaperone GrpE (heat shock protein)
MAAPAGNQNAARAKVWRAAINRALDRRTASRVDGIKEIDALAEQLLTLVSQGDITAIKEFGDRMDGKPAQAIVGGDDEDNPIRTVSEVVLRAVDAARN